MWGKGSKAPAGDEKERRDVAMSTQAEMILKKKREIEAKMAADSKKDKLTAQPRKPISMSIGKRWGLKGKSSSGGNDERTESSSAENSWKKYSGSASRESSHMGVGLSSSSGVSEAPVTTSAGQYQPSQIGSPGPQQGLHQQQLGGLQQGLGGVLHQGVPGFHGSVSALQMLGPHVGLQQQHGPPMGLHLGQGGHQGPHLGPPLGPAVHQGPHLGLPHHLVPVSQQQQLPPPGSTPGFGPSLGFDGPPPPQSLVPQHIGFPGLNPPGQAAQLHLGVPAGPPLGQHFQYLPQHMPQPQQQPPPQPQYDMSQPPPSFQAGQPLPPSSQPGAAYSHQLPPPGIHHGLLNPVHQDHQPSQSVAASLPQHPSLVGGQPMHLGLSLQTLAQPLFHPPPAIMSMPGGLPPIQYPGLPAGHCFGTLCGPDTFQSPPQPLVSLPPTQTILTSSLQQAAVLHPPLMLTQPPPSLNLSSQHPPSGPPHLQPVLSQPPPSTTQHINLSYPPPISTQASFNPASNTQSSSFVHQSGGSKPPPQSSYGHGPPPPGSQQHPNTYGAVQAGGSQPSQSPFGGPKAGGSQQPTVNPSFPPSYTSVPPPNQSQADNNTPSWWGDALAKAKTIATTLSKEEDGKADGDPMASMDNYGSKDRLSSGAGLGEPGSRDRRDSDRHQHRRRRSDSRERKYDRGRDRGRDRSHERHRSRSREADRSRHRDRSRERRHSGAADSRSSGRGGTSGPAGSLHIKDEEEVKREPEGYGYRSENYDKTIKVEVKPESRDIDMRKRRRESESYSPTRPDYKPTVKTEVYSAGEPLPSVVEELASMVAVSGEDLEDIARDRNKATPELKFLYERTGHLYKQYRARVAEIKKSFDDLKSDIKSEPTNSKPPNPEPERKPRRSRWGDPAQQTAVPLPPPGMVTLQSVANIGAPGIAIPTQLGGTVQKLAAPQPSLVDIKPGNSGLAAYAVKVFGTTNLTDAQWKQCEDQLKMSVVYGQLAAKQAAAKIMTAAGKRQFEYDSDEETEGGTWEHKARMAEMAKTAADAAKATEKLEAEGKHHIGDFLPPEELSKFMNKYKAMNSGTAWDSSEYQENRLTQNNVGFKMLQKMGWSEGAGLGAGGSGITAPVGKAGNVNERAGLGSDRPGEVGEDDDEFDTYRKRMMLAYRFRPNPLNNPRRAYY